MGKQQTPVNRFEKHPVLVVTIITLLIILTTDFIAATIYEGVVGDPFYYSIADPNRGLNRKARISSPDFHHGLKPNISLPVRWGPFDYIISTNNLGLKDRQPRTVSLVPEGKRFLFIGDSFTEGVGLSHDQTFVGLIANAWADKKIEVLNAGVSSYAPSIYFKKVRYLLEEVKLKTHELVVFIDISDPFDELNRYQKKEASAGKKEASTPKRSFLPSLQAVKYFFRNHSILYSIPRYFTIRKKHEQKQFEPKENFILNYKRGRWTVDEGYLADFGEPGSIIMKERMDQLLRLARSHDIKMTIAVYPWPTQIYSRDLDSIQVKIWSEWAEKNRVGFINLFPAFVSMDEKTNRRTLETYFFPQDMHWNAAGHEKVANEFLLQFNLEPSQ